MSDEPLPRSFHNLFVIAVGGMLMLWMAKVAFQLFKAADLNQRLSNSQALPLDSMSLYADDFQVLIRQHFNQILRIRRTVPSKPVLRHQLSVHLQPDSLALWSGEADGARADGHFGVRFSVDAIAPCSVRLFWGVSVTAANELVARWQQSAGEKESRNGRGSARPGPAGRHDSGSRSLLEMEELTGGRESAAAAAVNQASIALFTPGQFAIQSKEVLLSAGPEQRVATQAAELLDPAQLSFDLSAGWLREVAQMDEASVVPLVIATVAQKRPGRELGSVQGERVAEVQGQLTFVKFVQSSSGSGGPGKPEVMRQVSYGDRSSHEVNGVFGFEEEGESECMICYSRPKNVLLMPCRHCSVCRPCLRSLRDEKCPLCRSVFSSYITFPINRNAIPPPSPREPPPSAPEPPPGGGHGAAPGRGGDAAGPPTLPGPGGTPGGVGPGGAGEALPVPPASGGSNSCTGAQLAAGKAEAGATPASAPTAAAARGRGVAQAPRAAVQALRLSGRARCKDPTDTAQEPLLQDSGNAPQARLGSGSVETFCNRQENVSAAGEDTEETRILIQSRDVV